MLHEESAVGPRQAHHARPLHLLEKLQERPGAVIALAECGVELEQSAFEQTDLRRDFAFGENFQGPLEIGLGGGQRPRLGCGSAGASRGARRALAAVALK